MTAAQTQILDLFRALTPEEQEALLPELAEATANYADDLTPEQVAAIEEGLAQMRRGQTIDGDVFFNELADKFGFSRS